MKITYYSIQLFREKHPNSLDSRIGIENIPGIFETIKNLNMSFKTSEGERLTKTFIDGQIRKAKKEFTNQRDSDGIMYCEACGDPGKRLSVSHIVSVNDCQNDGMAEYAFDVDNMQRECLDCHSETELGTIMHHANFRIKMQFIEHYNEIKSIARH